MTLKIENAFITRFEASGDCDSQSISYAGTAMIISSSEGDTDCSIPAPEFTGAYFHGDWYDTYGWYDDDAYPSMNFGNERGTPEFTFLTGTDTTLAVARQTVEPYVKGLMGWLTARSTGSIELDTYYNLAQDNKVEIGTGNFSTKNYNGTPGFIDPAAGCQVGLFTESVDSARQNGHPSLHYVTYVVRFSGSFDTPERGGSSAYTIGYPVANAVNTSWFRLSGSLE